MRVVGDYNEVYPPSASPGVLFLHRAGVGIHSCGSFAWSVEPYVTVQSRANRWRLNMGDHRVVMVIILHCSTLPSKGDLT
jgi:hypothetical protein